ncbi:MAG: response regulator transcription factor [Chloroflexi bacterium]|nr:response regulator transcription factor [Chloroflexota bacterium]
MEATESSGCSIDQSESRKTTVLLADDHPLLRQALRSLLKKEDDFEIVAEAGDGEEATRLATELRPDVVIMDLNIITLDRLEATQQMKQLISLTAIIALPLH